MKNEGWFLLAALVACGGSQEDPRSPKVGGLWDSKDRTIAGGSESCTHNLELVPLEPWFHVCNDEECCSSPRITYNTNPPVSGSHWGNNWWETWTVHTDIVPRERWVHNLEHGGVIFLYRPDAPQAARLAEAFARIYDAVSLDLDGCEPGVPPFNKKRALVTSDPLLPSEVSWAVVVADRPEIGVGYRIMGDCIESGYESSLVSFAELHRNHSTETTCYDANPVDCTGGQSTGSLP